MRSNYDDSGAYQKTPKLAYYARCMAIYGSLQEALDLQFIRNTLRYFVCPFPDQKNLDTRKAAGENVMETVFKPLVLSCDILFFRALPSLKIPAGVGKEVEWALEADIPVLELPTRTEKRTISIEATREYLRQVGQRS